MAKEKVKFPKKIVTHYINILRKKIRVNGVLLFGSYASGNATKHSDIDLVIISSDFSRKNFDSRLDYLTHARDKTTRQVAMDIIGYTPKEFSQIEKHSAIMACAKKHGKWLYKNF